MYIGDEGQYCLAKTRENCRVQFILLVTHLKLPQDGPETATFIRSIYIYVHIRIILSVIFACVGEYLGKVYIGSN